MHLNQITSSDSPQPQQQRLEFRLNCDRQSDDCDAVYLRPKITALSAENGKKTKMTNTFSAEKRKCPKPSKIVIFGAKYENEFRSALNCDMFSQLRQHRVNTILRPAFVHKLPSVVSLLIIQTLHSVQKSSAKKTSFWIIKRISWRNTKSTISERILWERMYNM